MTSTRKAMVLAIALACSQHGSAQTSYFNSAAAVATALEGTPACLQWCAIGICYWLRCTLFGCSVETTLRYGHNYPDLVVSAWTSDVGHGSGGNPYVEAGALYGELTYTLGSSMMGQLGAVLMGGGQSTPKDSPAAAPTMGDASPSSIIGSQGELAKPDEQRHRNFRFKSTMAVGHPIDAVNSGGMMARFSAIPALCPSEATPMQLYYASEADAFNWRTGFVDILQIGSYIPGLFEVGIPYVNVFGNIYPRTGFLVQHDDYKAAATMAQRTVDIATRPAQLRIYQELQNYAYPEWGTPPGPSLALTDRWQAISPTPKPFCAPFGATSDFFNATEDGRYGWNYWQRYECCMQNEGAVYLSYVPINVACLAL